MSRAPVAVREVVAEAVRRAVEVTSPEGDSVAALFALLVFDPRNHDHVTTVVRVIVADALGDPLRETTANRWRPLLPSWLRPAVIGATVHRLIAAGLLVPTGRYVRCTDRGARNRGKLQPVYALNLAALDE